MDRERLFQVVDLRVLTKLILFVMRRCALRAPSRRALPSVADIYERGVALALSQSRWPSTLASAG